MSVEVWAMMGAGIAALVAGFILVRPRLQAACGVDKILVLAPIFEAASLAVFAAEHFTAAHDLMGIVPKWLPGPLFWTYFVGAALVAAAISFITWRQVRWSAALLAILFLIFVITIDLPNVPVAAHDRFFWILTVRETSFAGGAMVLAGSAWPNTSFASSALIRIGRGIVAAVMIFYATQHFLFPHNVPGVPLAKLTPAWIPIPVAIAYLIGIVLLSAGVGLLIRRTIRIAAAGCGITLLLLTVFFYGAIFAAEIHSPLAVEGLNYIFDTMLFAATVLLAGRSADQAAAREA
jgi:uncharacterized membrane protein